MTVSRFSKEATPSSQLYIFQGLAFCMPCYLNKVQHDGYGSAFRDWQCGSPGCTATKFARQFDAGGIFLCLEHFDKKLEQMILEGSEPEKCHKCQDIPPDPPSRLATTLQDIGASNNLNSVVGSKHNSLQDHNNFHKNPVPRDPSFSELYLRFDNQQCCIFCCHLLAAQEPHHWCHKVGKCVEPGCKMIVKVQGWRAPLRCIEHFNLQLMRAPAVETLTQEKCEVCKRDGYDYSTDCLRDIYKTLLRRGWQMHEADLTIPRTLADEDERISNLEKCIRDTCTYYLDLVNQGLNPMGYEPNELKILRAELLADLGTDSWEPKDADCTIYNLETAGIPSEDQVLGNLIQVYSSDEHAWLPLLVMEIKELDGIIDRLVPAYRDLCMVRRELQPASSNLRVPQMHIRHIGLKSGKKSSTPFTPLNGPSGASLSDSSPRTPQCDQSGPSKAHKKPISNPRWEPYPKGKDPPKAQKRWRLEILEQASRGKPEEFITVGDKVNALVLDDYFSGKNAAPFNPAGGAKLFDCFEKWLRISPSSGDREHEGFPMKDLTTGKHREWLARRLGEFIREIHLRQEEWDRINSDIKGGIYGCPGCDEQFDAKELSDGGWSKELCDRGFHLIENPLCREKLMAWTRPYT